MWANERMAELCKILGMPPKVTKFSISFDFTEGLVRCQCEHIAIDNDGKALTDNDGSLKRLFSEGEIVWKDNEEES